MSLFNSSTFQAVFLGRPERNTTSRDILLQEPDGGTGHDTVHAMPKTSMPTKGKQSACCLEDGLLLSIARGDISEPALSHYLSHLEDCLACCTRSIELERAQPGDLTTKLRRVLTTMPLQGKPAPGGGANPLQEKGLDEWLASLRGLRPASRMPELAPDNSGHSRFGNLQIQSVLGEGTASVVYKALDPELNRNVALKVLRPDVAARPGMAESFLREARALAGVRNPHLVILHKYSRHPSPYLEMELLKGRTLADALVDGPMPPERAMRLIGEIAQGLSSLHAAGLVHRDVKPANIWLDSDTPGDRAVLLDLGLVGEDNHCAGTRGYLAPEVNETNPPGPEADIYALGLVLRVMAMGAESGPRTQGKCPPELQPLVHAMMRLNPADRPTAEQVMEQVSQWQRARGATRRMVVRGLVVAGASLLGTGLWWLGRGSAHSPVLTKTTPTSPAGIKPARVVDRAFPGVVLKSTNRFGVVNGRHAMLTQNYLALAATAEQSIYVHRSTFEADNFGLFGNRAVFCSADGDLVLVDAAADSAREVARYKIDQGPGRLDPVHGFHVSPAGNLLVFTPKKLLVAVPVNNRYPADLTLLGATTSFANSFTPARLEWADDGKDVYSFMERGGITRVGPVIGGESPLQLVWAGRYTPNGLKVFRQRPGVPGAFCLGAPSGLLGIHGPDLAPSAANSASSPAKVFGTNFPMGIRDVHFMDTSHLVVLTVGVDHPLRVADISEREPVWYALSARDPLAIHTEPDKATLHCLGQDGSVRVWTLPDIQSQLQAGKEGGAVAKRTR